MNIIVAKEKKKPKDCKIIILTSIAIGLIAGIALDAYTKGFTAGAASGFNSATRKINLYDLNGKLTEKILKDVQNSPIKVRIIKF